MLMQVYGWLRRLYPTISGVMAKLTDGPTSEGVALAWASGPRGEVCGSLLMQVCSHGVEVDSPGFLSDDLGERNVGYGCVCGNSFGEYHREHVRIARLRDRPVDAASTDSLPAD